MKKIDSKSSFGKWFNKNILSQNLHGARKGIAGLLILLVIFLGLNCLSYLFKDYIYEEEHAEECSLQFTNVPSHLKFWSRRKKVTAYWMYNPSIIDYSNDKMIFVGRMSWQYGTDCAIIEDRKMVQYCILAHKEKWRDTSVAGEFHPETCTVSIQSKIIRVPDWDEGTQWFDAKLFTLKALHGHDDLYRRSKGIWMTAQKSEVVTKNQWLELEGDQQLLYQMLFMAYDEGEGGHVTRRFTRAVYYDPDPNHWTRGNTVRYLNNVVLPLIDVVSALCTQRPPSLPQFPASLLMGAPREALNQSSAHKEALMIKSDELVYQEKYDPFLRFFV